MSKFKEIRGLTQDELQRKLKENRDELLSMKMKNKLGQIANPMEIKVLRRKIAQFKTAMSQKLAR